MTGPFVGTLHTLLLGMYLPVHLCLPEQGMPQAFLLNFKKEKKSSSRLLPRVILFSQVLDHTHIYPLSRGVPTLPLV